MAKKDAVSSDADADAARDADAANEDDAAEIAEEHAGAVDDEIFEIEVDEDDIYAYIVDEDDNEIGFILLDENGVEQEYYYVEDEEIEGATTEDAKTEEKKGRFSKETYEVVEEATENINAIYKDGSEIASEFKGAVDDISSGFEFFKPSR